VTVTKKKLCKVVTRKTYVFDEKDLIHNFVGKKLILISNGKKEKHNLNL
jgi:hypothetical protein